MGTRTVEDKQTFTIINFCAELVKSSYPRRQTPTTSHTPITCTSGLFVFTALNIVWWTELVAVWPQLHMLLRGWGWVSEPAESCSSHNQMGSWTTEQQQNILLRSRFRMQQSRCGSHIDNRTKPPGEPRVKTEEEEEVEKEEVGKEER